MTKRNTKKRLITIPADVREDYREHIVDAKAHFQMCQDIVDGSVETVPHWNRFIGRRCIVFCNEEGKLRGQLPNPRATALWWQALGRPVRDDLAGDVVIVVPYAETFKITKRSQISGKVHSMDLPLAGDQFLRYLLDGRHVQDAFPTLNDEQREFLLTGITPQEWQDTFKPGDEE